MRVNSEKQAEDELWNLLAKEIEEDSTALASSQSSIHPLVKFGLGCAFLGHAAILLSVPPVIRGKGAPYLPTSSKNIESMFRALRNLPSIKKMIDMKQDIQFVDLGSGDGRVVFRAAREQLFHRSLGYEINPVLHGFASVRRAIQPKYWRNTNFHMQDLWKINLSHSHVVAVYGLHPIMDRLGQKMANELPNGAVVVSNVFTIPGWTPISICKEDANIHFYSIPESVETLSKRNNSMQQKDKTR
jgi:transposase-like protein